MKAARGEKLSRVDLKFVFLFVYSTAEMTRDLHGCSHGIGLCADLLNLIFELCLALYSINKRIFFSLCPGPSLGQISTSASLLRAPRAPPVWTRSMDTVACVQRTELDSTVKKVRLAK